MSKYRIITIERQYASGGRAVGKQVAAQLGVPCYGREILEMAAERNGQTAEYIEHLEETAAGSMIYSFIAAYNRTLRGEGDLLSPEDMLLYTEAEIIRELAGEGPCVFVGRSAGCILQDRSDVLRVFIHADDDARLRRAVEEYGHDPKEAAGVLRRYDKRRANFYNVNYNLKWGDKAGYHICLDSGKLGVDACARLLLGLVQG